MLEVREAQGSDVYDVSGVLLRLGEQAAEPCDRGARLRNDLGELFDVDICTLHHIGIGDEFRDPVFDLFDASNSTIRGSLYAYGNVSCTHLFDDTLLGGAIKFEPIR